MARCLGSWDDFGKMWRASGCDELASTHVPIIIHEDGVPHFAGLCVIECGGGMGTSANVQNDTYLFSNIAGTRVFTLAFLR